METTIIVLSLVAVAAASASATLVYMHHRRFEKRWSLLEQEIIQAGAAVADVVEIKDFYDSMSEQIKSQLEEAHRLKDRPRIQNLQRMKDRLETFRARTLERPVRKSLELAEEPRNGKKGGSKRKK